MIMSSDESVDGGFNCSCHFGFVSSVVYMGIELMCKYRSLTSLPSELPSFGGITF